MKNYPIVAIMLLSSLPVFSSQADADTVNASPQPANLVIYRPDDGSSLSYRFWVDGTYMGTLELEDALTLNLTPGEHVITANDRKRTQLTVTVPEQGSTFVRSEIYRKVSMSLTVEMDNTSLDNSIAGL